jgi:hypothetical protein
LSPKIVEAYVQHRDTIDKLNLMISSETIKEFQEVLKSDFDKEITIEESQELLTDYVSYISLLSEIDQR